MTEGSAGVKEETARARSARTSKPRPPARGMRRGPAPLGGVGAVGTALGGTPGRGRAGRVCGAAPWPPQPRACARPGRSATAPVPSLPAGRVGLGLLRVQRAAAARGSAGGVNHPSAAFPKALKLCGQEAAASGAWPRASPQPSSLQEERLNCVTLHRRKRGCWRLGEVESAPNFCLGVLTRLLKQRALFFPKGRRSAFSLSLTHTLGTIAFLWSPRFSRGRKRPWHLLL